MIATLLHLVTVAPPRPQLLVHVMPWFAAPPVSKEWGWHWTMGKVEAPKQIATHYHPLIGPYDSSDPAVIELQVQLMKLAGMDGALIDWYGNRDRWDYLANHRNTEAMRKVLHRAGMKFAVVYEDQTVPQLISGGVFSAEEAVSEGNRLMKWVDREWFADPGYLRLNGKPVFLVFGPQYYPDAAWPKLFEGLTNPPHFYSLHHVRGAANSAYDWPLPTGGTEAAAAKRREFNERAKSSPETMPVAFPRFHDYYRAAGLDYGFDEVGDEGGKTFRVSLKEALAVRPRFVQIATWNDWGEGTQIEPSQEFGYRDLEEVQWQRRALGPLPYSKADLRLPMKLYRLRKKNGSRPLYDKISESLLKGDLVAARQWLARL